MVDHVVNINNSIGGQMMIRDTGWSVEFYIKSGNTSSWDGELGWSGNVNGAAVGTGVFNYPYPGGEWREVGRWAVSTSQTVYFNKTTDSGSQGLGTATSMAAYIPRSTVPGAPSKVTFSEITHNSVKANFVGYTDGGSAMIEWQISFGTNGGGPIGGGNTQHSTGLTGTRVFTGLTVAEGYFAWARGRNANGWGPWGPAASFATKAIAPNAPTSKVLRDITHYNMTFEFDDPLYNGGSGITGREYQYSSNSAFSGAAVIAAPTNGVVTRSDLAAGTTYYWRGRVKNAIGVSPWSAVQSARTHRPPAAPTSKTPYGITHTGMSFEFDDAADNGGTGVTSREYQASTSSSFAGAGVGAVASNGIITRYDLTPGVLYYWRGRTRNAAGYSAWSTVRSAYTLAGAKVKIGGIWKSAVPYCRVAGVWKPAVPYVRVAGVWKITG